MNRDATGFTLEFELAAVPFTIVFTTQIRSVPPILGFNARRTVESLFSEG